MKIPAGRPCGTLVYDIDTQMPTETVDKNFHQLTYRSRKDKCSKHFGKRFALGTEFSCPFLVAFLNESVFFLESVFTTFNHKFLAVLLNM